MGSRKTVTMPRMEKPLYKLSDSRTDCGMRTCENNVIKKWWFLKALFTSDKLLGEKRQEKGENWKWNTWILCSPERVMMKHNVTHNIPCFSSVLLYEMTFPFFHEQKILLSNCSTHHGNKRGYHTSYPRCTGACSQADPAHARGIHLRGVYIAAHISYAYEETRSI